MRASIGKSLVECARNIADGVTHRRSLAAVQTTSTLHCTRYIISFMLISMTQLQKSLCKELSRCSNCLNCTSS